MMLEVWAPRASELACQVADSTHAMTASADGWWRGPDLAHGQDYALLVDGEGPFPDPRSAHQPLGVHGPSRVFDPGLFRWRDHDWPGLDVLGAVIYELHVGTFTPTGTLDSAMVHLADLAAQGVQMVELMPLAPFPGRHGWGYDGVSLYAVHEPYGGPAALQRFVDAAHRAGLGVCLDVVYNHLGPDGNYLSKFGPYFTSAHHTPWGEAVNLDQADSAEVREYFFANALRWFTDFHVDALRLDAVHELKDESPRHFLAELSDRTAQRAQEVGRPLSLIAESDLNDARMVTPTAQGGMGMTAQWNDDVHHALHAYLTGERHGYYQDFGSIEVLDHAYQRVFWHDGKLSPFRGTPWGAPVEDHVDRRRFVVCASNHDQVGNRALGDRPASSLTTGAQAASLAMVLLSPFTPMLFMGEEYGETRPFMFFTDHDEPLGSAVTAGRQREFGEHGWEELYGRSVAVPDPQDRTTFLRSKLGPGLGATSDASQRIQRWLADVMGARRHVTDPDAWKHHPVRVREEGSRVLVLEGPVVMTANLTESPVAMDAPGQLLASIGDVRGADADGKPGEFTLAADAVALWLPTSH